MLDPNIRVGQDQADKLEKLSLMLSSASLSEKKYHSIPDENKDKFCELLYQWINLTTLDVVNVNYHAPHTRFTLSFAPKRELQFKTSLIRKIILIEFHQLKFIRPGSTALNVTNMLLILKDNEGNTNIYGFNMMADSGTDHNFKLKCGVFESMISLMRRFGCEINNLFTEIENRTVLVWEYFHYKNAYMDKGNIFYSKLHPYVASRTADFLMRLSIRPKKVTLFSFGAGDGQDLRTIKQGLTEKGIKISKTIGFELNKNNFQIGKRRAFDEVLIEGNVLNAEELIREVKMDYDQESFKIAFFIGILVSRCLRGTYEALKVIQQVRTMDFIVVSGTTSVLLNKSILKAAGFRVIETQLNQKLEEVGKDESALEEINGAKVDESHVKKYFELTWMNNEERLLYLIKRSRKRSNRYLFNSLDLSFSANPLRDIKLFENNTLEEVKKIDISWSYFKENEIDEFVEALLKLKSEKLTILLSNSQPFYHQLVEAFSKHSKFIIHERLDSKNEFEVPTVKPREGLEWGAYEKLPVKAVSMKA